MAFPGAAHSGCTPMRASVALTRRGSARSFHPTPLTGSTARFPGRVANTSFEKSVDGSRE
jgi:hypothetical protein